MSDDNPYRAPAGAVERIERRTRRPLGPISAGVVAMVSATVLLRGTGLPRRTSTRPPIELTRMTEQCSTLGCELPRVGRGIRSAAGTRPNSNGASDQGTPALPSNR